MGFFFFFFKFPIALIYSITLYIGDISNLVGEHSEHN